MASVELEDRIEEESVNDRVSEIGTFAFTKQVDIGLQNAPKTP